MAKAKAKKEVAKTKLSPKFAGKPGKATAEAPVVPTERRASADRRASEDRRKQSIPVAVERRQEERRTKIPRRRQIDPTTCERDYNDDEIEFMRALDDYKRRSGRMFPTCSELLEVFRGLGYVKSSGVSPVAANAGNESGESHAAITEAATGPVFPLQPALPTINAGASPSTLI